MLFLFNEYILISILYSAITYTIYSHSLVVPVRHLHD